MSPKPRAYTEYDDAGRVRDFLSRHVMGGLSKDATGQLGREIEARADVAQGRFPTIHVTFFDYSKRFARSPVPITTLELLPGKGNVTPYEYFGMFFPRSHEVIRELSKESLAPKFQEALRQTPSYSAKAQMVKFMGAQPASDLADVKRFLEEIRKPLNDVARMLSRSAERKIVAGTPEALNERSLSETAEVAKTLKAPFSFKEGMFKKRPAFNLWVGDLYKEGYIEICIEPKSPEMKEKRTWDIFQIRPLYRQFKEIFERPVKMRVVPEGTLFR